MPDYLPRTDANFDIFQDNFMGKVQPKLAAWGIPVADFTALQALQTAWNSAWALAKDKDTRSRGDVRAKEVARKGYEAGLRRFVKTWIAFNNNVTDADIESLGLKVRDIEPTPKPKIATFPIIGLKAMGGSDIEVRCRVTTDQTRPSKHRAADGIECRFVLVPVGEMPPDNWDDCPKTQVSKKAQFIISCGAKGIGQRFYGFFRWANISKPANSGPWTNAINVVIA